MRGIIAISAALLAGCLQNLHQQKYFERLEALAPEQAAIVREHRADIEIQLRAAIKNASQGTPTRVPLWGESADLVRTPYEDGKLYMRGHVIYDERSYAPPYKVVFQLESSGHVTIVDAQVFE